MNEAAGTAAARAARDAAIAAIYAIVASRDDSTDGWEASLAACAECVGADAVTLDVHDGRGTGVEPVHATAPDPVARAGRPRHRHSVAIDGGGPSAPLATVHFDFADGSGLERAMAEDRAGPLLEHLERVLTLRRTLERARQEHRAVRSIVDRVAVGICVVDASARVLVANDSAHEALASHPLVGLDASRRITCVEPDAERRLREAIADACANGSATSRLVLRDRAQEPPAPLMIEIDAHAVAGGAPGRAMITIIDPSLPHDLGLERLVSLYGLSEAEASVFAHMVRGLTNRRIAEVRHVSAETVRSQVTSVLRKLGVSRRSELFVLVSSAAGEWRPRAG